jgi:hypothetical protein
MAIMKTEPTYFETVNPALIGNDDTDSAEISIQVLHGSAHSQGPTTVYIDKKFAPQASVIQFDLTEDERVRLIELLGGRA